MKMQPDTVLLLRTSGADGSSYGGYRWPGVGEVAVAPDWNPEPTCGGGLHGYLWGCGNAESINWDKDALWQVVEARADEVVDLGGKCKVPRATVVHVGTQATATSYLAERLPPGSWAVIGGTANAGDHGTANAGNRGTANAGNRGTANAGNYGTANAGNRGTANAGDCGTATAGDCGTATAGDYGTATAGDYGTIIIRWFDGSRVRLAVGYVGEDGILPNVAYRCDGSGKFLRADGMVTT